MHFAAGFKHRDTEPQRTRRHTEELGEMNSGMEPSVNLCVLSVSVFKNG